MRLNRVYSTLTTSTTSMGYNKMDGDQKTTANSRGQIVPGSKVRIPGNSLIFDVGEVDDDTAHLYLNGTMVTEMPVGELQVI